MNFAVHNKQQNTIPTARLHKTACESNNIKKYKIFLLGKLFLSTLNCCDLQLRFNDCITLKVLYLGKQTFNGSFAFF